MHTGDGVVATADGKDLPNSDKAYLVLRFCGRIDIVALFSCSDRSRSPGPMHGTGDRQWGSQRRFLRNIHHSCRTFTPPGREASQCSTAVERGLTSASCLSHGNPSLVPERRRASPVLVPHGASSPKHWHSVGAEMLDNPPGQGRKT